MSKEKTGQRHKNKVYFKDQDLDLYLQAFPLNFQTYGGASAGEAFYAAFTEEEGADAHSQANNQRLARHVVFDWLDETFAPRVMTQRVGLAEGA